VIDVLQVRSLSYAVSTARLIDDASFAVPSGGLIALVGPNGAGKSTLLRLMSGTQTAAGTDRRRADGPAVLLDGTDLLALRRHERARRVALVEQDNHAEFSLTARQAVELGRIPHESRWGIGSDTRGVVDEAIARAGVRPLAERELKSLSGGEQQRVQLARALAQQPRLLLLDEPTNHLDIRAQLETLRLLRDLACHDGDGLTVVLALHDLNLAVAYCDHVVVLSRGQVQAVGPVTETITPELIATVYGVDADVLTHPRTGRPLIAFAAADDGPESSTGNERAAAERR